MVSQTKENYLKAIYFLHQKGKDISLSELAERMEVSKPTVNDMVKKLQDKDWVIYKKYKPLSLTKKGEKLAALILRKHRLTEMFLTNIMGFGWEEVHEIAEEMEHITSEVLFDRMDELLGFPTVDPHGSPIPDKNGRLAKPNFNNLSEIPAGKKVKLRALENTSSDFLHFLNKKGIKLGIEIQVVEVENYDKSMSVIIDNKAVVLSENACGNLLVEQM